MYSSRHAYRVFCANALPIGCAVSDPPALCLPRVLGLPTTIWNNRFARASVAYNFPGRARLIASAGETSHRYVLTQRTSRCRTRRYLSAGALSTVHHHSESAFVTAGRHMQFQRQRVVFVVATADRRGRGFVVFRARTRASSMATCAASIAFVDTLHLRRCACICHPMLKLSPERIPPCRLPL